MNYRPKNDTIGVPGKGFIPAADFTEEDLNNMMERAKNRKLDVHSFLINAGLTPVQSQPDLFPEVEEKEPEANEEVVEPETKPEEPQEEKPKRRRRGE